jgi:hypothetical protein
MEVDVWMFLEPAIALLMGGEIIEDDVQLAIREGGNYAVHEAEELDTPPPLGMLGNNSTRGDFERCKQGRGAAYPEALECVCSSPDCRLAYCLPAGDRSVQQAHDRQNDAAIC